MTIDVEGVVRALDERGFAVYPGALGEQEREILGKLLPPDGHAARNLLWERGRGGLIAALEFLGIDTLARGIAGSEAVAINATYFDKTAGANWKVPGHQDRMMPVEREEDGEPGWSGWCTKAGVVHAEPPVAVLERLVTVRLHLDDCPASNGALALVPGSHRRGKLDDAALSQLSSDAFVPCETRAGDLLVLRPLTVHRSAPATTPHHRRVLQVVYAAGDPGEKVRWRTSPLMEPEPAPEK